MTGGVSFNLKSKQTSLMFSVKFRLLKNSAIVARPEFFSKLLMIWNLSAERKQASSFGSTTLNFSRRLFLDPCLYNYMHSLRSWNAKKSLRLGILLIFSTRRVEVFG